MQCTGPRGFLDPGQGIKAVTSVKPSQSITQMTITGIVVPSGTGAASQNTGLGNCTSNLSALPYSKDVAKQKMLLLEYLRHGLTDVLPGMAVDQGHTFLHLYLIFPLHTQLAKLADFLYLSFIIRHDLKP